MRRTCIGPCIFLLWTAACADARPPELAVEVRDSAGVTIVQNPDPGRLPVARPEEEPLLSVGVLEGDPRLQLHDVRAGSVLGDGRVALLNAGTREVRIYDADGGFLASHGGPGDGPGEYANPTGLHVLSGDSLLVWDGRLRRATVLHPDGTFARSFRLEGDALAPALRGVLGDGSLLVVDQRFEEPEPGGGVQDQPGPMLRYDREGRPLGDTLGLTPWMRMQIVVYSDGRVEGGRPALDVPTLHAVAAGGVWVGIPREARLRLFVPGVGVARIVRWPAGDRTVTEAVKQAFLEAQLGSAPNEEVRAALRRGADDRPYAEILPAYEDLGVDATGRLWVREWDRPGTSGPQRWWVLDPGGRALHAVELPEAASLLWADGERVLLRIRDELDVERVRLHRLGPPTPAGG